MCATDAGYSDSDVPNFAGRYVAEVADVLADDALVRVDAETEPRAS